MLRRILFGPLLAAMIAFPGGAHALQNDEKADDIRFVWYPTAECPDKKDGPGATPATAIKLIEFEDLYYAVGEAISADNDSKAGTPSPTEYECRWVTLTGFFQWTDYYHYRGNLYADLPSAYFRPDGNIRYIVESFRDPAERRARLNGSRAKLTGRFYDLCRRAAMDVPGDATLVFGPCHYGDLSGLMLRDVIVDSIEAGPNLRLRGERNRGVVGDLAAVPKSWPETSAVRKSFFEWLGALRAGREAYWTAAAANNAFKTEKERADFLTGALDDHDDWISFLTESEASPLKRRSDAALKRSQFRLFAKPPSTEPDSLDYFDVTACVCLTRDCADDWPLFQSDAVRHADDYLCNEISSDGPEGAWRWTP